MSPDEQFKRNIAYKLRINEILLGKPILNQERFAFLELGDKKIIRVNVIGNIVEKYDSTGEKQYTFITIDDGSGQIKIKAFGDDAQPLKNKVQGQTILIIGVLRYFNNEIYISPEIVKEFSPEYLVIRKLETQENAKTQPSTTEKKEIVAIKDKILEIIKNSESEAGIDIDNLIMKTPEASPELINQETKKMLEEGIIFEPRPGRLRYLG